MQSIGPSSDNRKVPVAQRTGFMTINEVSEFLRIPKRTLYEWVSQRRIPHFKFGGALLRFKFDEIETWTRQHYRAANALT